MSVKTLPNPALSPSFIASAHTFQPYKKMTPFMITEGKVEEGEELTVK